LLALLTLVAIAACRVRTARSERSFAEIQGLVAGRSAAQIVALLGEPDSRLPVFDGDERWTWWSYTFLDGSDVPPELRGKVVHLEIVVVNPDRGARRRPPYSEWWVDDSFGITYRLPKTES
jgi:hypothetical protein